MQQWVSDDSRRPMSITDNYSLLYKCELTEHLHSLRHQLHRNQRCLFVYEISVYSHERRRLSVHHLRKWVCKEQWLLLQSNSNNKRKVFELYLQCYVTDSSVHFVCLSMVYILRRLRPCQLLLHLFRLHKQQMHGLLRGKNALFVHLCLIICQSIDIIVI